MKVAITVWGNRISPVFDSAQTVLLAELLDRKIANKNLEVFPFLVPEALARRIVVLNPDVLICGAISEQPAVILERAGILLIPFISGRTEHVLEVYAQTFEINSYRMPGCRNGCHQKHRHHLNSERIGRGAVEEPSRR